MDAGLKASPACQTNSSYPLLQRRERGHFSWLLCKHVLSGSLNCPTLKEKLLKWDTIGAQLQTSVIALRGFLYFSPPSDPFRPCLLTEPSPFSFCIYWSLSSFFINSFAWSLSGLSLNFRRYHISVRFVHPPCLLSPTRTYYLLTQGNLNSAPPSHS